MPKPNKVPGPPLPKCELCGNYMPTKYEYTVCVACRAKCSKAAGVGNHQYTASLNDGCHCVYCDTSLHDAFRALPGEK